MSLRWTIEEFKGTSLRESDVPEGRVLSLRWDAHARYAWDAGIAIGRFLQGLKEGRILGVHCKTCRRTVVPPRIVCEWCFRPMVHWVPLQDTGTVQTVSVCYVNWDASRRREPEFPAVIALDGASAGCGILHILGEVTPQTVRIGMRVQAVWKPPQERIGAITDIRYFRPI